MAAGLIDEDDRVKNDKDNARRALAIAQDMVLSHLPPFCSLLSPLSSLLLPLSLASPLSPGRPLSYEVCTGGARCEIARRPLSAEGGMRVKRGVKK